MQGIKGKSKNIAEKNGMWKGDKVGYGALHDWVKNRLPKLSIRKFCSNKCRYESRKIKKYEN